jgi:lipopolysaccharide transport protein LptA
MKPARLLLGLALFAAAVSRLPAQTADVPADAGAGAGDVDTAAAPGSTVINSDELRMDQLGRTAVFTGNVVVVGNNFNMKCEEMTVYFTPDSKIDNIVAKGNVVIVQPGRITHCGQAQYFHDEDKFVLTDQPDVLNNEDEISGAAKITIWRTQQTMKAEGGRIKTTVIEKNGGDVLGGAPKTPAPATP